jgi:hypothetical protein
LEPGPEIVRGGMGGGTLKAFPAPGMIDVSVWKQRELFK